MDNNSNNIIHFENLWEQVEKISITQVKDEREILGKIAGNLDEIRDIYKAANQSNDEKLIQGMKSKAIGRLIFNLTALSAKEKIDVYAALKDQFDTFRLRDKQLAFSL